MTLRWEEIVGRAKVPSTSQTYLLSQSVNLRHLQEKSLTIWTSSGTRQENCELHLSHTHTHSGERSHTASMCGWDQSVLVSDISLNCVSVCSASVSGKAEDSLYNETSYFRN